MTKHVVLKDQLTANDDTDIFPVVDPNMRPFGSRVLVQIRRPKKKVGNIIRPDTVVDTQLDNTCVAKIVALGPLAFKNRNSLEPWAEGSWADVGTYVFAPKYGGIRWEVPTKGCDMYPDKVQFALVDDLNLLGDVIDPRKENTMI